MSCETIHTKSDIKKGYVFKIDQFNLYSRLLLRERELTRAFITSGHNLNNTMYDVDTVLISDTRK